MEYLIIGWNRFDSSLGDRLDMIVPNNYSIMLCSMWPFKPEILSFIWRMEVCESTQYDPQLHLMGPNIVRNESIWIIVGFALMVEEPLPA